MEGEDGGEKRTGMEGEGSGVFMDDSAGGWVRVDNWQQPRPRRARDVNKARPLTDSLQTMVLAASRVFTCAFLLSALCCCSSNSVWLEALI